MEGKSMSEKELQPEVIVFAGPNGSGKSTITKLAKTGGIYINESVGLLKKYVI